MSLHLFFVIGSLVLLGAHALACAWVYHLAVARWRRLDAATLGAAERKRAGQKVLNWLSPVSAVSALSLGALAVWTMARQPAGWILFSGGFMVLALAIGTFLPMTLYESLARGRREPMGEVVRFALCHTLLVALASVMTGGVGAVSLSLVVHAGGSFVVKAGVAGVGAAVGLALVFAVYPSIVRALFRARRLDGELRRRFAPIEQEIGIRVDGLFLLRGAGYRANAMVTGIIPGRRFVFLTQELVEHLDHDEVCAVVAHELAHIRHRHLLRRLGLTALTIGLGNAAIGAMWHWRPTIAPTVAVVALWTLNMLLGVAYMILVTLPMARRHERQADATAARVVGADLYNRALRRIHDLNLSGGDAGRVERLFATHPSLVARLQPAATALSDPRPD